MWLLSAPVSGSGGSSLWVCYFVMVLVVFALLGSISFVLLLPRYKGSGEVINGKVFKFRRTKMTTVGGIKEVEGSANSIEIESLAKFAVEDYNKKQNVLLEFDKVVNTKEQVVAGTLYYITLEATDGGQKRVYEAKVWVKLWLNFQEVQEFKLLGDTPVQGFTT